jgi:hypothetical protein
MLAARSFPPMLAANGQGERVACLHCGRVKTTRYFEEQVIRKRPYLRLEWIESVLRSPAHRSVQPDGRIRHWGYIPALRRWIRVITLEDGETVHNAFPDRDFEEPGP